MARPLRVVKTHLPSPLRQDSRPVDAPLAAREDGPVDATAALGAESARALAAKNSSRLLELLDPEVDFRGLTPSRSWEAGDRDGRIEWMRVVCSGFRPAAPPDRAPL